MLSFFFAQLTYAHIYSLHRNCEHVDHLSHKLHRKMAEWPVWKWKPDRRVLHPTFTFSDQHTTSF